MRRIIVVNLLLALLMAQPLTVLAWGSQPLADGESTHTMLVEQGLAVLMHDLSAADQADSALMNVLNTLQTYIYDLKNGAVEPDYGDQNHLLFQDHFYDPHTRTNFTIYYDLDSGILDFQYFTAEMRARQYMGEAFYEWRAGNYQTAVYKLGLGLHYFSDLNHSHHASNAMGGPISEPTTQHSAFEAWVDSVMEGYRLSTTGVTTADRFYQDALVYNSPTEFANVASDRLSRIANSVYHNVFITTNTATWSTNADITVPMAQQEVARFIYRFAKELAENPTSNTGSTTVHFRVKTKDGDLFDTYGTNNDVFAGVELYDGRLYEWKLDQSGVDDHEKGDNRTYSHALSAKGEEIKTVWLRKQRGWEAMSVEDNWTPEEFQVTTDDGGINFYKYLNQTIDGNWGWVMDVYRDFMVQNPILGRDMETVTFAPGVVEAENYNPGGAGTGYYDTSAANYGGTFYRFDQQVDVYPLTSAAGTGFGVGWVDSGEWMAHTLDVKQIGTYDIGIRYANASGSNQQIHLEFDGVNKTGSVVLPDTGAWDAWQTAWVRDVALDSGFNHFKVVSDTGNVNLDNYIFQLTAAEPEPPTPPSPTLSIRIKTRDSGFFGTDGTDDDIYVGVNLADGRSQEWYLDKSGYNDFEKGDNDTYDVTLNQAYSAHIVSTWLRKENFVDDDWRPEEIHITASDGGIDFYQYLNFWFIDNQTHHMTVNNYPVAANDSYSSAENSVLTGNVLSNDSDAEGTVTVIEVNGSSSKVGRHIVLNSGSALTLNSDGSFNYEPVGFANLAQGASDLDSFTYTIADSKGVTDTATVSLTITGVNDAPVALADTVLTNEDTSIVLNLLANDFDPEEGVLTLVSVDTNGTTGLVTTDGNSVTYNPNGQFEVLNDFETMADSFSYTVQDAQGATATATVSVTISGVTDNTSPIATNVSITGTLQEGQTLTGSYTFTDTDGDSDTSSTYQWLRADDAQLTTPINITGATSQTYTLTNEDVGQYLAFCVTPSDGTDVGTEACSAGHGSITAAGSANNTSNDFNGDGKSDLVWQRTSGELAVWYMDGAIRIGSAGLGSVADTGWQVVGVEDFNNDNKSDLVWQHTTGELSVWYMDGTMRIGSAGLGSVANTEWQVVGVGDFNSDNKHDLVWQRTSGELAVWYMDGTTRIGSAGLGSVADTEWQVVGVGDFNNDSKADLVWQRTSGELAVWYMDGATQTGNVGLGSVADTEWQVVGVVDLNNDTKPDLVWQRTSGELAAWYMDGAVRIGNVGLGSVADTNWRIVGN